MEFSNPTLDADGVRQQLAERVSRARAPRMPATPRRHVLAQRLRRVADRLDS
jgi:hypothetical protein